MPIVIRTVQDAVILLSQLPVHVEIIKHPSEYHGKSTSCHAAILAPDMVRIHKYPAVPDLNPKKVQFLRK